MGRLTHTVSGKIADVHSPTVAPIRSLKAHFLPVQEGSGEASPTNIRNITFKSSLDVYKFGVNVFDGVWEDGGLNTSTGEDKVMSGWIRSKNYLAVRPSSEYVMIYEDPNPSSPGWHMCMFEYDENKTFINYTWYMAGALHTFGNTTHYVRFFMDSGYTAASSRDVSVNYPSTVTEYIPYVAPEIIPVEWTSNNIVYGGYIDLVTGVIATEYKMWTANTANMNRNSDNYPGWNGCGIINVVGPGYDQIFYPNNVDGSFMNCGRQINIITKYEGSDNVVLGRGTYGLTEAEWKALAIDVQFCYRLPEPEIVGTVNDPATLFTSKGITNFADSDNMPVEVEYDVAENPEIIKMRKKFIASEPHLVVKNDRINTFNTDMVHGLKSLKVAVNYTQDGTGDPSPTNIRAIHGFSGVGVNVTGKNIFDSSQADWVSGKYINENGEVKNSSSYKYNTKYIPIKPSTTYYAQCNKSSKTAITMPLYDINKNFIERVIPVGATQGTGLQSGSFTTPANAAYFRFSIGTSTTNVMFEESSEVHEYESFGNLYEVDWSNDAGEIAVGTLDLVTGVLIVEAYILVVTEIAASDSYMAVKKLGEKDSINRNYKSCNALKAVSYSSITTETDNVFAYYRSNTRNYDAIGFRINGKPTGNEANTSERVNAVNAELAALTNAGTPLTFVYYLNTPDVYQLTPAQISTVLGQNNIWSDDGGTEVKFWTH